MDGEAKTVVDRSESQKLNLSILKQGDANIEQIVDGASHVSLYDFQLDVKAWKRSGVEGPLFVVKRKTSPRFQIIIMNRLSTKNFVEDVIGSFDFERQSPYLIYKSVNKEVHGIWFYEDRECEKIFKLLQHIASIHGTDTHPEPNGSDLDQADLMKVLMSQHAQPTASQPPSQQAKAAPPPVRSEAAAPPPAPASRSSSSSKSRAAEDITNLLGMLGMPPQATADPPEPAGTSGQGASHEQVGPSREKPTLLTPDLLAQSLTNAPQAVAQVPAERQSGGLGLTRAQLRRALQRVMKRDDFVDMLLEEITKEVSK